ncbi:efflux RND transporter permease subunit [Agrilutibacter solisilvae]|uniref:MMPL family transporter n=1 Tax=Agrilutibacter solisilvae TaxID=2763317 RepID=A0A974Y4B3_9GAMM|nr:MMPL family transporter [Lysobacter solisilvae]QSX77641.1 MMPL family transporter [Lysobacter solisilvae]
MNVIKYLLELHARSVVRHRWWILVLGLLATLALGAQIGSLRINNDPDLWAPQNHEFTRTTRELERVFGGRNFTIIGLYPTSGDVYQPGILKKVQAIQQAIEAMPQAVRRNVVSLGARRVKDISATSEGMAAREMLDPIPTTPAEFAALRQAVARNPIYIDALVSSDGRAAAIVADFTVDGRDAAYAPLHERIQEVLAPHRDATVEIVVGGQPVNAAHLEMAMQKMPVYFGIAFLIILAVQYFAFRSVQGMVLPLATGLLAVVWGLGTMALAGVSMDALNTTTPILIMAVATGHSVQILKRYYEELALRAPGAIDLRQASREAVEASLRLVAPVMAIAGLIAAAAFFSLLVSDVEMIRNFGLFAGCGILAAMVIELTIIPALRAILPPKLPPALRRQDVLDRGLARLGVWLTDPRHARRVVGACLVMLAVVSLGALRIEADSSFKQYFQPDSPVRQADARLNASFGGTDSVAFLIEGPTPDSMKDPRVLLAMRHLQDFLEAQPHVGKTQSVADLLARMNQAMHGDDPSRNSVPTAPNLAAQYLLLYSLSGDPEDFDNLVDASYQRAVVWAYLKTDSTTYALDLYQRSLPLIAREFPPGFNVRLGGSLPQTVASNESLVATKTSNILQIALIVFVLSSLALRSLVGGLLVVVPLAAIVLMNLGLMGWLGVPLDMGTASITAMVTGIGADYEIYMLYRLREEYRRHADLDGALQRSLATSGKAVLLVAISIAGGYAALLISDFEFYPRLGSTMMITMGASAVLSLLFLRAMVALIRPRFITGVTVPVGALPVSTS